MAAAGIYCSADGRLLAFYVPFLYAFGASTETIPYASDYLKIYLAGTIFVELALGLNTFIIVQGESRPHALGSHRCSAEHYPGS